MAYNLVRLYLITNDDWFGNLAKRQLSFVSGSAQHYPAGYSMFLIALSDALDEPEKVVIVKGNNGIPDGSPCKIRLGAVIRVLEEPTEEYRLLHDQTTYYVCRNHSCQPPVNKI